MAKKVKATKNKGYTWVEKNIYKTAAGTYRLRLNGYSSNYDTLKAAKQVKKILVIMMKKKLCAGFDGNEHEAYIYKNIDGKKYCKSCTFKLQKPKPIKKVSEKQKFKLALKKVQYEDDKAFYMRIWNQRFNDTMIPFCEVCSCNLLGEPTTVNFHHILEKRNWPEFRHKPSNIAIVCPDCHSRYETNPSNVDYLAGLKKLLLNNLHILKNQVDG